MQLTFNSIKEPFIAGEKWKRVFDNFWPGYKTWFLSNNSFLPPDLFTSQEALKKYMPKMWPTYVHLCNITNADMDIARFLTGFQPPAYITACAQAVINTDEIQLIRNYDYHPDLLEGNLFLTKWNERKVIASSDCLIGVVDGMNDAGLCLSQTFGGRKEVGYGFGIPFILRYVLEFCSTTKEAVKVIKSIPSYMSYNVTIVDKTGETKTVRLAPDKVPFVSTASFATNHQGIIDWPENAAFNQTLKRFNFIKKYLKSKNISTKELAKAFLHPPLYNTQFSEGFGTLYTAVYQPQKLRMQLMWPNLVMEQSFDHFMEEEIHVEFKESDQLFFPDQIVESLPVLETPYTWQDALIDSLVRTLASKKTKKQQRELRKKLMPEGKIAWKVLMKYWNTPIITK